MNLLAVETSSNACSVALQLDDEIVERHVVEAKSHTRLLLPMIVDLLAGSGLVAADLDALVLGNGPGSFIGMRLGASVVQGLAYAAGRNIVAVSSLAAVAAEAMTAESVQFVAVAQDARMSEVYLAGFARGGDGIPVPYGSEAIHPIGRIEFLAENTGRWLAAGEGWRRYPALLASNSASIAGRSEICLPRARYLLGLANRTMEKGGDISPEQLTPAYLRDRVATPPQL